MWPFNRGADEFETRVHLLETKDLESLKEREEKAGKEESDGLEEEEGKKESVNNKVAGVHDW